MEKKQRPLRDWTALALMGFEEDLYRLMGLLGINRAALASAAGCSRANISQLLNGESKNPQLKTLVKLARALDSRVQVRMVRDGHEVVRVMDIEAAGGFDDAFGPNASATSEPPSDTLSVRLDNSSTGKLLHFRATTATAPSEDVGGVASG